MKIVVIVLLIFLCILMFIAYSLLIVAHEADEKADRMYKKWKEKTTMLNGYDITNMSNDDINMIMKGIDPTPYDPDKRIETPSEKPKVGKERIKIFSARDPEFLASTVNKFFDENEIAVQDVRPYIFSDKGVTKHCVLIKYVVWE